MITNKSLSAHKIGITNLEDIDNNSRLIKHRRNGWSIYKTQFFDRGESALSVEQLILVWIRESLNLGQYLSSEQMPQGGWTETIDASEIDLPTIWAKVEELSRVRK